MHVGAVKYCVCTFHFIAATWKVKTPFYKTATHMYKEVVVLHLHSSICHAEKSPSAFQNDTSFSSKSEIFINVVDPTKPEIY